MDLTHKGIDPMIHSINRVSKQIVSAFIIAALIIGAAIFITAEVQPLWKNYSVLGLICLTIASLLGIGMLGNIRKGDYDV